MPKKQTFVIAPSALYNLAQLDLLEKLAKLDRRCEKAITIATAPFYTLLHAKEKVPNSLELIAERLYNAFNSGNLGLPDEDKDCLPKILEYISECRRVKEVLEMPDWMAEKARQYEDEAARQGVL